MSHLIKGSLLIFAVTLVVASFSAWPGYRFNGDDEAALVVSIRRITEKTSHCTAEEKRLFLKGMKENRPHMNRPGRECGSRERASLTLKLRINSLPPLTRLVIPSGLHNDGAAYFHERFILSPGHHTIVASVRDDGADKAFAHTFRRTISFAPRQVITLDFASPHDRFILR